MRALTLILALALALVVPVLSTTAQDDFVAERTWTSSEADATFLTLTIMDTSEFGFLADATVLLTSGALVEGLQGDGFPESAFHAEAIGDADRRDRLIITASGETEDGMPAAVGATVIESGTFVQMVLVATARLTEDQVRDRLLDLAERVPAAAASPEELLLGDIDVSALFGIELHETTLDDEGTPEAG